LEVVRCKLCGKVLVTEETLDELVNRESLLDKLLQKLGIKKKLPIDEKVGQFIVSVCMKHIARHPSYMFRNASKIGVAQANKNKKEVLEFWLGAFEINSDLLERKYGVSVF